MHVCSTSSALTGFAASHGKPYNYDHDHVGQAVAQRLHASSVASARNSSRNAIRLACSTRRTTCRTIHHSMQQIYPDMLPCLHHELQSAHPAVVWILLSCWAHGSCLPLATASKLPARRKVSTSTSLSSTYSIAVKSAAAMVAP